MTQSAKTPRLAPLWSQGKPWFVLATAALLSACGADGAPTKPGITVSAEARAGVTNTN
jgi:hypothetical protein